MSEYFTLTRIPQTNQRPKEGVYLPWVQELSAYGNDVISDCFAAVYSKTGFIHSLSNSKRPIGLEPSDCLRCLLTDTGLLFQQTRERSYHNTNHQFSSYLHLTTHGMNDKEYSPALHSSQKDAFQSQIEAFRGEDLSSWKEALPVLGLFLNPKPEQFEHMATLSFESDSDHACKALTSAFGDYLKAVDPRSPLLCRDKFHLSEASRYFCSKHHRAEYGFVFLHRPDIIFRVFRSPSCQMTFQTERNWKLSRTVREACSIAPFPLTVDTLDADRKLYFSILDACRSILERQHQEFPFQAWSSLWSCIEQTVHCLTYETDDLLTSGSVFKKLIKEPYFPPTSPLYQLLDIWLDNKLHNKQRSFMADLWRSLLDSHIKRRRDEYLSSVKQYMEDFRRTFEAPGTEPDDMKDFLSERIRKFSWNNIQAAPTYLEFCELTDRQGTNLTSKQRNYINSIMSETGLSQDDSPLLWNYLQLTLLEWTLLQASCEQARLELMNLVYTCLTTQEDSNKPV